MDADKAQIADVLIRYATGIDFKDWALLRTCWTDDVELHNGMGPTYHRLTNFAITVDGDRATARSYVHAVLQAIPDDPASWIEALGHYDDEFVRTPEGWRVIGSRESASRDR